MLAQRRRDRSAQIIREAMRHVDVPGAGAAKRRKLGLTGRQKSSVVMKEFYRGTLRHGSTGEVVTEPAVAKAIAMSEGRKAESGWLGRAHLPRAHRAHHSPYAIIYGGSSQLGPKAWSGEAALSNELFYHGGKVWDTDVPTLDEAIEQAIIASRKHQTNVVVYDQHNGEVLYTQNAPAPEPSRREHVARKPAPIDEHAVTELRLYAENESAIYPQHQAIVENIKRKMARGVYDPGRAPALWGYWVDAAARRYIKEFGGDLKTTFPPAVRRAVATEVAHDEGERIKAGEYGAVASKPNKGRGSDAWRLGQKR